MTHPRITGLYNGLIWCVGMRFLTGTDRPSYIRDIRHEMLGDNIVMLTCPTADGPEICFVATDLPEEDVAQAIHGPYARCHLAAMEAVGNA